MLDGSSHAIDIVIIVTAALSSHVKSILKNDEVIGTQLVKTAHHLSRDGTYIQTRSASHGKVVESNACVTIHSNTIKQGCAISFHHGKSYITYLALNLSHLKLIPFELFMENTFTIDCSRYCRCLLGDEKKAGTRESVKMLIILVLPAESNTSLRSGYEVVIGNILP